MTNERRTTFKNLVAFVSTRPPCVVFFISLSFFAFGFFALGYYVQHNDIVDSTASQSWDNVYKQMSSFTFCLNSSTSQNKTKNQTNLAYQDYNNYMVNVSLPFEIAIRPLPDSQPLNTSQLTGMIPWFDLEFQNTVFLVYSNPIWISLEQNTILGPCIIEEYQLNARCREMTYYVCATFMLPKYVAKSVKPRTCQANSSLFLTAARMDVLPPNPKNRRDLRAPCEGQMELTLRKQRQFDTNILLGMTEKTQLNLRLQLGGYFLFVILLSFVLFAAIRGRPYKTLKKITHE